VVGEHGEFVEKNEGQQKDKHIKWSRKRFPFNASRSF
jgi:hypothetical protein